MKRLLVALVVIAALVWGAGAVSLNFQDPEDFGYVIGKNLRNSGGSLTEVRSTIGGNNYVTVSAGNDVAYGMMLATPEQTTYAAATLMYQGYSIFNRVRISLLDSSQNSLYSYNCYASTVYPGYCAQSGRFEVVISGGSVYIYQDGLLINTPTAIASNPYYVAFGVNDASIGGSSRMWDDYVYGGVENRYIFGNPETSGYTLQKDLVNPAATGFFNATTGIVISSTAMPSQWGRSNITYAGNESIVLRNYDTKTIYLTNYTNTAAAGFVNWDLAAFFSSTAPYGYYEVTIPGSISASEPIFYLGGGATVTLDADEYSKGDVAVSTYTVADDYWEPGTYSYRLDMISGTTGDTVDSQEVTTQTGSKTITFQTEDGVGVYYSVLIRVSGTGTEGWMNFDYAELNSYVTFIGYVNDETGTVLSGANVNITQNSIIRDSTTITDGNYTATGLYSGATTTFNVTKTGYIQYYASLIPLAAKTVPLNFTLVDSTPTYTGLGIGGVARDGILTGSAITFGYGRPIPDATIYLVNASNGESYTKTTNNAGYYLCDEGASCFLTTKRPYDVWGEKARYDNSPNYTAVTA
jgi:hypothetical protein